MEGVVDVQTSRLKGIGEWKGGGAGGLEALGEAGPQAGRGRVGLERLGPRGLVL